MRPEGEDFDPEKIARKINQIRTTNSGLANEIEKLGGVVDLGVARLEHFFGRLVDLEIITEEQRMDEQFDWEMHLKPQLVGVRDGIKARIERAAEQRQRAVPPAAKKELWTPPTKG